MHQRDLSDDAGDAIIIHLAHSSQADSYCPPDQLLRYSLLCKVETQLRSSCSGLPPFLQILPTKIQHSHYQPVPLSPAENLLSVLANLGAGAGRGVLLATVLLLSSVTSCTSRLLCSAWMADAEGSSDFFFNCDLKSSSPLTGSFSALTLAELGPPGGVTSFLRLVGIPLCSQGQIQVLLPMLAP